MEVLGKTPFKKLGALLMLLVFSPGLVFLCAGGAEEEEKIPANGEWTLCITAFDVSALPVSRRIMGDILARDLQNALSGAGSRLRGDEETAFYEDYAWSKSRSEAAGTLAAKRNERDLLLYKGDAGWKYRKNLKAKNEEIAELEEALLLLDEEKPLIDGKPVFKFVEANKSGTRPAPPVPGAEYRFCTSQKADAFITGELSEFHGRVFARLKMYTFHTRSYSYEDSVLFSPEDIQPALDELSARVFAAVLGTSPAVLEVRAEQKDAVILVDGSYAGRGETGQIDHAPGEAKIEIYGEKYDTSSFSVELNSGEIAELYVNLSPLGRSSFTVDVPESPGASVYLGGLYLGASPLLVDVPGGRSSYISVETSSGETGSAVYEDGRVIRGSAEFVRAGGGVLNYETSVPINPKEERVNKARRGFYGAYGRLWIGLPLSMLAISMANNYIAAYNNSPAPSEDLHDKSVTATQVRNGAYALIGIVAVDVIIGIIRYLYVSRVDAEPIARFPDAGPEEAALETADSLDEKTDAETPGIQDEKTSEEGAD